MNTKLITGCLFLASQLCLAVDSADLVRQGDALDRQYKADEALKFYLPAEKLLPDDASLLVKIARQYVYRSDDLSSEADKLTSIRTGLSYAERAVKLAPNECDSHLAVAICLGKMTPFLGNKENVETSYKIKEAASKAVKLNPKNDYAWHMLGRWHQAMSELGTVTRGLAKIVYGGLPDASNEEAVACFKKAISLNPNRLIHYIELGRTYAQMGNADEAKELINKGLAMPNKEKDDAETKQRGKASLAKLD